MRVPTTRRGVEAFLRREFRFAAKNPCLAPPTLSASYAFSTYLGELSGRGGTEVPQWLQEARVEVDLICSIWRENKDDGRYEAACRNAFKTARKPRKK